ncbi:MAG TPA: 3-oxoadipate enol-lactonase [Hyphomicrobiales bacterium]|nr:3-oxoadipate enol-lactonase [Hyphomicrobiales bacterium]
MPSIAMGDGCKINYRFDGQADAPVLLMSNSLSSTLDMWEPQIAGLSSHFRILRYDHRGHGASDAPSGPYTIDRLGQDAKELVEALGVAPVAFCGLSLGGMVGMWLAAKAPQLLTRAVFANTSAYFGNPEIWNQRIAAVEAGGMRVAAEATIQRWLTQEYRDAYPEITRKTFDMIANNPVAGYLAAAPGVRDVDLRAALPEITTPSLVITGALDPSTPPAMGEAIEEAIPDARLAILDSAHMSNIEKTDEFNRLVVSFLSQH